MDYKLIFEKFLDGFEGLSSFEVADFGDKFLRDVLMVAHADLDGREDPEFLFGDEVEVLNSAGGYRGVEFHCCCYYYSLIMQAILICIDGNIDSYE